MVPILRFVVTIFVEVKIIIIFSVIHAHYLQVGRHESRRLRLDVGQVLELQLHRGHVVSGVSLSMMFGEQPNSW